MSNSVWMLIVGMALVTYIPRTAPFFMVKGDQLSKDVKVFLDTVPYASLGALILPGGIGAIENHPIISIIGLLVAIILSLGKQSIVTTICGSIFIVAVFLFFSSML